MLDITARNKAIHLTWLKAYLNLGEERPTWTFFADAIISTDIPPSHRVDEDPESRVMPFLQSWEMRARGSTLPDDLKEMLKVAKEFNVRLGATNPTNEVKEELPIWYHAKSNPTTRKLYKTKEAKCLRQRHHIKLVRDATTYLANIDGRHIPAANCTCETCKTCRTTHKCPNPSSCINLMANLISKIAPKWNPSRQTNTTPAQTPSEEPQPQEHQNEATFDKGNETSELKNAIKIFGGTYEGSHEETTPTPQTDLNRAEKTTVYTDGACNNNGNENAEAGSGIWYGPNDPQNLSVRVPLKNQSNQSGELYAVLMAVKNQPNDADLEIITD
ncbi:hypothetical protein BJ322DRAFT_1008493, partial [Thelephora terrestris]